MAEAHEFLAKMRELGVAATPHVHSRMVDVLARNGQLDEAEDYLMANAPECEAAFDALIEGCKAQHDLARAQRLFARAQRLPGFATRTQSKAAEHMRLIEAYMADQARRR